MSPTTHSLTMIFLRNAIEESPKTQKEIARDAGFVNANALSMMKTGETKVPISRIPALAEALDIEAGLFLKTALREYHPEIWMTIEELMRPKLHEVHEEIFYAYECACMDGPIPWSQGLGEALGGVFYLACQKHAEETEGKVTI
ncbi:helix-turn-helix domain-containing protein [Marivita sp.]|uniref:helix-turn-helix domain-containing protein n=1 Tax=Marivita sp. TaxID=2003365 RepID=UPI003F703E1D